MRLQTGQPAKPFEVRDTGGRTIKLEDYRGKKLMLSFYRYASCPLCNIRVHRLIEQYDELTAKGLHLLAVFQSPEESIARYVGRQEAPFPIVADSGHKIYRLYGVETSWLGFLKGSLRLGKLCRAAAAGYFPGKMEGAKALVPADFLIGPDLTIRRAFYGADIADHLPLDEILFWLKDPENRMGS